MYLGKAETDAF